MLLPLLLAALVADPVRVDLRASFEAWNAAHGGRWRLSLDPQTGRSQMLAGGRAAAPFRPRVDADCVELARRALAETRPLHGVDAETLVLDRALFLPLGQIGSGDKETVRFRQAVRGVPGVAGFVNVLLAADGSLLSIQSTRLPGLAALDTRPALVARRALDRAVKAFREVAGALPTALSEPV